MIKWCYVSYKVFFGYFLKNCCLDFYKDKYRVIFFISLKKKKYKKIRILRIF